MRTLSAPHKGVWGKLLHINVLTAAQGHLGDDEKFCFKSRIQEPHQNQQKAYDHTQKTGLFNLLDITQSKRVQFDILHCRTSDDRHCLLQKCQNIVFWAKRNRN